MGVTISGNSALSANVAPAKSSGQSSRAAFNPNSLSLSGDSANTGGSISAAKLAARSAAVQLSATATAINSRESVTAHQLQTVTDLLSKAYEIKNEVSPTRRSALVTEASAQIADTQSQYESAVSDDPTLAETGSVSTTLGDSSSSSNLVVTNLTAVQNLEDLGVSSELSFDSANIDDTIDTLAAAQKSLLGSLEGYESSRSKVSSEIAEHSANAGLEELARSKPSIEEIASQAAKQINSSTADLLTNHRIEQLDVQSLINGSDVSSNPVA